MTHIMLSIESAARSFRCAVSIVVAGRNIVIIKQTATWFVQASCAITTTIYNRSCDITTTTYNTTYNSFLLLGIGNLGTYC